MRRFFAALFSRFFSVFSVSSFSFSPPSPLKSALRFFFSSLFPPRAAASAAVFCVTCLTIEPSLSRAPANASRTSRSNTAPFCALNRFPATVLWALGEQSANTPVSYVELRNDAFLWCAAPSQYPWSAAATTNFVTKKRELFNADHAHSSVQPGTNTTNVNGASFSLASVRTRSIVSATRRITPLTNGGFTCAAPRLKAPASASLKKSPLVPNGASTSGNAEQKPFVW